jgi:hypothetical protein
MLAASLNSTIKSCDLPSFSCSQTDCVTLSKSTAVVQAANEQQPSLNSDDKIDFVVVAWLAGQFEPSLAQGLFTQNPMVGSSLLTPKSR